MFIDESGANELTGSRKFGWSPKGLACHEFESIKRSERWSILPAMTVTTRPYPINPLHFDYARSSGQFDTYPSITSFGI